MMDDSKLHVDGSRTWIETATGRRVDFLEPRPEDVDIRDIAAGLAKAARYNGQNEQQDISYSVAEHCYLMAEKAAMEGRPRQECLMALLHDAPEYVLGDPASPLKQFLPDFKEIEARHHVAVCAAFGLPVEFPAWIKEWDERIIADEKPALYPSERHPWNIEGLQPLGVTVQFWPVQQARVHFLGLAHMLGVEI